VARYEYDFWGVRSKLGGSAETPWGYTGHYTHAETGLVLAPYRAYDPETARWLSRDPIGENGGINLYGYVGNNPINAIDPLGLDADIDIYRTNRYSSTVAIVTENGKVIGGYIGNASFNNKGNLIGTDYQPGEGGPPVGSYELRPKNNENPKNPKEAFVNGTPSITGSGRSVGSPADGWNPTVRMHPYGGSTGCQTASMEWANRIWDIMDRNLKNGGTRVNIHEVSELPSLPKTGKLPAPTSHPWPVFNNYSRDPIP